MSQSLTRASKFMSLLLRHQPEAVGLELDSEGWAVIDDLIARTADSASPLSGELILKVVETSAKQRFALSDDGLRIRANQGHSIQVDLNLEITRPPEKLFHGTASRFLESIQSSGLVKGNRQHVHLSADKITATQVGQRHGKPVVLTVDASAMQAAGHAFYLSNNGVWLTDHVPACYLQGPTVYSETQ